MGFEADGTEMFVPFPEADIYDSEYDSVAKVWTLTCYDDMQKLEKIKIRDVVFPSQQVTLYEYAEALCAQAGIRVMTLSRYYNGPVPKGDLHCLVVNYSGLRPEQLSLLEEKLKLL